MENASKALLMAGGILISILIVGLLLLMFNQLSAYQKENQTNTKNTQLTQFNNQFEKYIDDNGISGTDMISLINKIIDYNKREGTSNEIDYNIKMSITISGFDEFAKKYGYDNKSTDSLFAKQNEYKYPNSQNNNPLKNIVDTYSNLSQPEVEIIKKVYTLYNGRTAETKKESKDQIKEKLKEINYDDFKTWDGTTAPTIKQIANYKEYTEFKSAKFIPDPNRKTEYKNEQIQNLYFTYTDK